MDGSIGGHGGEVLRYLRHFEECLLEDRRPLVDEREGAGCIPTCAAAWESVRPGTAGEGG
ncbi:MAG TPA: hypothetical protein VG370_20535 [Chloroflexota bacterium]|nr:hypothetical protein [Chloroflexota bacterium]